MGGELLAPGNGGCYWHVSLVLEPGEPRAPSSLCWPCLDTGPLTHMESLQDAATPTWPIPIQPPACSTLHAPIPAKSLRQPHHVPWLHAHLPHSVGGGVCELGG